jgi:DNA-binding response OmpR family regulator
MLMGKDIPMALSYAPQLSSRRILIVEDEYFIAGDLTSLLESNAAVVVGPVASERDARAILEEKTIDCAILDVNLSGEPSFGFAALLRDRAVPFLFVSGYDKEAIPEAFRNVKLLEKPFSGGAVLAEIGTLLREAMVN